MGAHHYGKLVRGFITGVPIVILSDTKGDSGWRGMFLRQSPQNKKLKPGLITDDLSDRLGPYEGELTDEEVALYGYLVLTESS